jgi:hypothetical protein
MDDFLSHVLSIYRSSNIPTKKRKIDHVKGTSWKNVNTTVRQGLFQNNNEKMLFLAPYPRVTVDVQTINGQGFCVLQNSTDRKHGIVLPPYEGLNNSITSYVSFDEISKLQHKPTIFG